MDMLLDYFYCYLPAYTVICFIGVFLKIRKLEV